MQIQDQSGTIIAQVALTARHYSAIAAPFAGGNCDFSAHANIPDASFYKVSLVGYSAAPVTFSADELRQSGWAIGIQID